MFVFSKKSFIELFSFGSKLLLSGLIDTIYRNVYYLIIGKFFSAAELGYYTRADQFQTLPSSTLNGVISRVSYPILSSIQDEPERLKSNYKKLIRSTMFLTFFLMLGLAAVAKPMVLTLIGEKWLPSVIYLQMLCFVGMQYPLHSLNLNILQVKGRSDLFLRLEIIKKALAIPVIFIGIFLGIKSMILGMFFLSLFAYYLNSYYSGKLLNYSTKEQLIDIFPSFSLALTVNILVYVLGLLITVSPVLMLTIQVFFGMILTIGICELFKLSDYIYMKQTLFDKILKR